jgi:formamidopyrimidine-DNA glycosylase
VPELPDITVYLDCLRPRIIGRTLQRIRIHGPFLLRSVDPPIDAAESRRVESVGRVGKRIVLGLEGDLFLVVHLMIAGRLLWKLPRTKGAKAAGRIDLAAFDFDSGTLILTEAGTKKRASLNLVAGRAALALHDPGGLAPLSCTLADFAAALRRENHTIKRILTDPRLLSGIGNAYSDEILHAARLSPLKQSSSLDDAEVARLHSATRTTLQRWIAALRHDFGIDPPAIDTDGFPGRFPRAGEITAFRPDFAVHGRFGKPCPVCRSPVQRIVRAENEVNYCPTCQTGGRILADRSLSRLLKNDWPRTVEEWEGIGKRT